MPRQKIVRDRQIPNLSDVVKRRKTTLREFAMECGAKNADDLRAVAVAMGCTLPSQEEIDEAFPLPKIAPIVVEDVLFVGLSVVAAVEEPAKSAGKKEKKSKGECKVPASVVKLKYEEETRSEEKQLSDSQDDSLNTTNEQEQNNK